jgi:hypothetical protein
VLAPPGLGGALALGWHFFLVAAGICLLGLYSGPLKHIVIIDVLVIAFGFVLRAVAGAVAVESAIGCSSLLLLAVRGAGQRRHELSILDDEAIRHRLGEMRYRPSGSDDWDRDRLGAHRVNVLRSALRRSFGSGQPGWA